MVVNGGSAVEPPICRAAGDRRRADCFAGDKGGAESGFETSLAFCRLVKSNGTLQWLLDRGRRCALLCE